MRDETRQSLQLIVDKAGKLRAFGFENHVREVGFGFSVQRRPEGDWLVEFAIPDEKERDAFLLTFRFFYQRNEKISIPNLAALAQDAELSEHWRHEAGRVRDLWQQYLDGHSAESVDLFEGHPTRGQMLEAGLYGGLVHANRSGPVANFERWTSDDIRASVFQQEFAKFLIELLALIYHIADVSAEELRKDAA